MLDEALRVWRGAVSNMGLGLALLFVCYALVAVGLTGLALVGMGRTAWEAWARRRSWRRLRRKWGRL